MIFSVSILCWRSNTLTLIDLEQIQIQSSLSSITNLSHLSHPPMSFRMSHFRSIFTISHPHNLKSARSHPSGLRFSFCTILILVILVSLSDNQSVILESHTPTRLTSLFPFDDSTPNITRYHSIHSGVGYGEYSEAPKLSPVSRMLHKNITFLRGFDLGHKFEGFETDFILSNLEMVRCILSSLSLSLLVFRLQEQSHRE
jgi:hypothetical protein